MKNKQMVFEIYPRISQYIKLSVTIEIERINKIAYVKDQKSDASFIMNNENGYL